MFQLLWYPSTTGDLDAAVDDRERRRADPGPRRDRGVHAAGICRPRSTCPSRPSCRPTLAPANAADLSGLPPAFIGTAEYDPLRDDGARYAELLSAAGVPVELYNAPTLVHGYVSFALVVPAAAEATNRGLAALKAALHAGR